MSSLALSYKNACIEGSWDGWKSISGINYAVAGGNYHVVYSASLSLDTGQKLTGFTVSTNFVGNGSTGARTVVCYLYTFDPTGSTSGPPSGYAAAVTLNDKYFYSYGEYVSFAFSNLDIQNAGTIYLWFANYMSANPGNDQIYHYATGNGYTRTPAITGAAFDAANLTSLTVSSSEVATGNSQVVTVGNANGRTVTIEVYYGSTRLYSGSTTTGQLSIDVVKGWFATAGLTSVASFSVSVRASAAGTTTLYADFTVKAGDDMKPTVGTPTVSLVQTGAAATNFPNTYIAGCSKAKVEAAAAAGSNAAITGAVLSYPGGDPIRMTYNSTSGKYEATTPVLNSSVAFTVTATDQRGLSGSKSSQTVTVTPYTPPSLSIDTAYTWRCDSGGIQERGGAYWRAKATATWYSGLSGNSLVQFTAEIQGVGSAVSLTSGQQTTAQGGTLTATSDYTLVFTIQDKVSEAITRTFRLESIQRHFVLRRSTGGTYLGIGGAPTRSSGGSTVEVPEGGGFLVGGVYVNAVNMTYSEDVSGASFGKDFLNVDPVHPYAPENAAAGFTVANDGSALDLANWSNAPSGMGVSSWWNGIRQVWRMNAYDVLVQIFEIYPSTGRIWSCWMRRVNGEMVDRSGWRVITPAAYNP